MSKERNSGKGIYTLALNRTASTPIKRQKTIVTGKGTKIEGNPALLKRANKKAITNHLVLAMIDVAKANGEKEIINRYWNTYYCQTKLTSKNGRYYCNWCKNRYCATCCGIRKAMMIKKYLPIISEWEDPHLVTITLKSVKAHHLNSRINQIIKAFQRIKDRCNKRHTRTGAMKIMGIKSLECNFNANKRTYNPHYHLIVPSREIGLYIMQEWKKELNKKEFNVGSKGQHLRKVERTEKDLVEVIKYGAKILSDPDPTHKRKRTKGDMKGLHIYANALHTIYNAFDKHHLFSRFGFKLPEGIETETSTQEFDNFDEWKYEPKLMDWVNTDTGKLLTEYEIDSYLDYILKNCINLELN